MEKHIHSFQRHAASINIRDCATWFHFLQGIMRLCARKVVFFEKYCCTGLHCRILLWQQTSKSIRKLVCLIIFSSLGGLVVLPMVISNFLRWCSDHENSNTHAHLDDVFEWWLSRHGVGLNLHICKCVCFAYQTNSELGNILLYLLLLLLKDVDV